MEQKTLFAFFGILAFFLYLCIHLLFKLKNLKADFQSLSSLKTEIEKTEIHISQVQHELSQMQKMITQMAQTLDAEHEESVNKQLKFQKKQQWYKEKERQADEITHEILSSPSSFYYTVNSCMTPIESHMFYFLTSGLQSIFPDYSDRKNYFIFPQISLHAFIKKINKPVKTTVSFMDDELSDLPRRNLVGKNVDFILCCRSYKKKNPTDVDSIGFFAYKPVLMIEIDGTSHFSDERYGKESFDRTHKSDLFKNALAMDLNISLLRYKLSGTQIDSKQDSEGIQNALRDFFRDFQQNMDSKIYCYDKDGEIEPDTYYSPSSAT